MFSMRKHPSFLAYFNNTPLVLLDAPDDQDTPHRLEPLRRTYSLPYVDIYRDAPLKAARLMERRID